MIRVLFAGTSTTLGGAEKTLYTIASRLDRKKFAVPKVVSLKPSGFYARKLESEGVSVSSLGTERFPNLRAFRALKSLIADYKPDVVHAFMYQAVQLCRLAKVGAHFKLASSPRVSYRTRSRATLLVDRALKGLDDVLISECAASRKYLIERQGYGPNKVKVVYNGVAPAARAFKDDIARLRSEAGVKPGDFLAGSVGRLDRQKDHATLLKALARLKDVLPNLRCVIIGEGPERGNLDALVKSLGLAERVRLLGERQDAAAWMSSLDLFILPSLWEGLPNVLLEAMALSVPCAAAAVDGVPEIVRDRENGLLFPAGDPAALAGAIEAAAKDARLRQDIAKAGRISVLKKFDLAAMTQNYEALYASLSRGGL